MIRAMRPDDAPVVEEMIRDAGGEQIDFNHGVVFVNETEGVIDGVLSARRVWQLEPLIVTGPSTLHRSRVALLLYRAAEAFISSRILNPAGPRWFFVMTRRRNVKAWADRLGWFRQYRGGSIFVKYLP